MLKKNRSFIFFVRSRVDSLPGFRVQIRNKIREWQECSEQLKELKKSEDLKVKVKYYVIDGTKRHGPYYSQQKAYGVARGYQSTDRQE